MRAHHMSGAGNDFAVVDIRGVPVDMESLSKDLCARLKTDGFLAIDHAVLADFKLHFYNSDGSRGEMCGNGARCVCKYAYDHGIAGEAMTVETDAGLVYGWRLSENRYKIKLNDPGIIDLQRLPNAAYVELGSPGIPHSVTECPGLEWEDKNRLLPAILAIRNAPQFPKGVNVNLYCPVDENTVKILTYERGVEDFTLACGTGSASVAVALWMQGKLPSGRLTALNPGGTLKITVEGKNGEVTALYLEGPVEVIDTMEI
ncbi:MAG: diaminopimelate epimerase [Oscillospiraceae bacterium]|nr:diaminopimelate epimerase [Oscillospiraceae bacterium]